MRAITTLAIAALFVTAIPAAAQDVRMSDNDIKALVEQLRGSRERFEDALDGSFKSSVIRGESGEVDVNRFLDDLETNVNNVKDRFTDDYAASTEVLTFLKQCTQISGFMARQPGAFKGKSEWDTLATQLGTLARHYGTSFPTGANATARRMNDKEVAAAVDAIGKSADRFRNAAKNALKTAKADPALSTTIEREGKALTSAAKTLKSRVSGHKPASNEAKLMFDQAAKVEAFAKQTPAIGTAESIWGEVATNLEKVRQAFTVAGK